MKDLLLLDHCGHASLLMVESTGKGNRTRFAGKMTEWGKVNKNKRLYSEEIIRSNVDRIMPLVEQRMLLSELDHPSDSIVHLDNVCCVWTKLYFNGPELIGEGEVLNTPAGIVLESLLQAGVMPGISSRGVGNGTTNSEGVMVISDNYKLITFDIVCDASSHGAQIKEVLPTSYRNESKIPTLKNENTTINKLSINTLIPYLDKLVDKRSQIIKERYTND